MTSVTALTAVCLPSDFSSSTLTCLNEAANKHEQGDQGGFPRNDVIVRNSPNPDLDNFVLESKFETGWCYLCSIVY